jgi:predicted outer membrane repeat protein
VYVLGAGVVELVAVNGSVPATSATVLTLGTGFNLPHGVAVDGAGNVFVADYGNSAAKEIPLATPPSLSFANTAAGATSTDSPQSVTVQNIGSTALTFPVPSVGANPAFGTQSFSLANGGATTCPQLTSSYSSPAPTLATGASCTYGFTFVPTAVGTLVDSATLYDTSMNLSPATQSIALSGTATGDATPSIGSATISASPTTQTVGASSTVTVHVADAAGYGIQGSAVQVSSSGNAIFQSSGTNTASGMTDSNGNLVVSLTDGTPETVTLSSPQVTGTTSVTFVPHSLVVTTTSDNPSPIDQCGSSPTNGPTACRAQVLMEALVACGQDGGTATPGSCSLREATETAGVIGATNITFDPTVFATPQTIVLTYVTNNSVFPSGPFTVTDNTNITGPRSTTGANLLTLDGAAMAQILTFEGGTEAVSNLILQNGLGTGDQNGVNNGAAIYIDSGAVTLSGSTILNNNATGTAAAGGLYLNSGSLTILDSTFSGNTSSTNGGAIEVASGALTVTNSTFGGNAATLSGGALYVSAGATLSLSSSTVSANQSSSNSGGIFNGGTAVLQNSIVEGNTAPAYPDIDGAVSSTTGSLINTGNTTSTPGLAALGSYGGPTPTMLPEPGSPALCAGVTGGAATDQRGFLAGLGGYCPIGAVDAGAVQTYYALAFNNIPASISAGSTFSPQPIASLIESGAPYTATSPAITVGDTASPSALTGIYASTLGISQGTTASSDQLTATLALSASPPITLSLTSTSFTITTPVAPAQRITFPAPTPVVYGGGTIPLAAVASSGLAVTYTVSGPATLSGSTLTPTGPGVVVVTASQPGNGSYVAANPVTQTVSIAAPLGTASLAIGVTSSPVTLKVAFANSFTLESIVPAVQAGAGSLSVSTGATGACAIGTPYTAGQSCTLSVTFTPSSAGLFAGVVQLDDGSSTVQAAANVVSVRYR